MENPIKMDDLGVPLFLETSIWTFFLGIFHYNCALFGLVTITYPLKVNPPPSHDASHNPNLIFLVRDPYHKPSFATVAGVGVDPTYPLKNDGWTNYFPFKMVPS